MLGRARDIELVGGGRTDLEDDLAHAASAEGLRLEPEPHPEAGWPAWKPGVEYAVLRAQSDAQRHTAAIPTTLAAPALADDRVRITQYEQELCDAISSGTPAVWDQCLDPDAIYAEEDASYKHKDGMIKEIRPLPPGVGGEIKVELLAYHEGGDTAVALFRQHEVERYYGRVIHASYLLSTVWKKRAAGRRQIEGQVLAERTDPPAIALPTSDLQKFAGTYKHEDSEPTYTITLIDGKLMGGRTGKAPSEWNAETRDVFFIKGDPRIRKIFQYDASGKVTGFIERRESWDIVWNKLSDGG